MTRDPLARNISSFFENLSLFFGYSVRERLKEKHPEVIATELCNLFIDDYIRKNGINFIDCDPLTWFDEEIKEVFNLNVYDSSFSWDKGYTVLKNQKADLLIIRLEDLNHCYSEAISEFINVDESFNLEPSNVAGNKGYAEVYSIFKKKSSFPPGISMNCIDQNMPRTFIHKRSFSVSGNAGPGNLR